MTDVGDNERTESKRRLIESVYPSHDIFKEKGGITSLQFHEDDDGQKSHNGLPDTLSEMSPFKPFRTNYKCSVCFILSFLGLILGIILLVLLDPLVNNILAHKMAIVQNREGRRFWQNPPATIHRKMYIWHCTNPIAVQNGAIPELVERGPYVYREEWNRSSITYSDGFDRLSYIPSTTLYFDRNQSIGPDDEYVSVINVPLMAMAYEVQFYSKEMQEGINFFIELLETQLFVNVTVKQLMEGYTDPLIETASKVKPGVLKDDKFGILQARNTSYYQNFTIQTGINDITQVAKIITFNGVSTLNYWSTPQANMLNGTDGSLFPPNLKKDKKVYSYSADMCRSYYLSFLRERKDGYVTLYDYHLSADVFNMSREENRGFCGHGPCLGDGVLNISTCYLGVWGFISSPHFFQADEKFRQDVHGMQPNKNKHAFIMSFDPVTSVPFDVNVRLQLSFYMPNIKKLHLLKSVKPIIMPIVWFDDEARLTPKIHRLLSIILVSLDVASYIKFILPSLSLLLVTLTSLYIFFQWRRSQREVLNSKVLLVNRVNENEDV
ncbi:unnamed protein product [Rotaria socialis]|uniref:Uncharacterized protein n=1 Tax=Rotaria socialis TaxID=392032 RepID=A0A817PP50_9BILA|nr:unnamed protein product [Rotaria socialis]CAF3249163.1 unnamed protein product [Rotaria socialis]CAF3415721.1 unnamed protein product [Rotaria socialis]CAF3462342.1 unnamed protein product [Rotaria socialis]CAF4138091.1 unnamed protein product [Rotaria socialis]